MHKLPYRKMLIGSKLIVFYEESLRIFPTMAHKYADVSWANRTDHTEEHLQVHWVY